MTTISQVLVLVTLYSTICAKWIPRSSPNLKWTVDPTKIKTGLDPTTNLSISCHYKPSGNIDSISLGRRCGRKNGYRMALLERNTDGIVVSTSAPAGATFTGDLDNRVITMETADASSDDACLYICHVGIDRRHHWAYVYVPETKTTMEDVVTVLEDLQTKVSTLETKVTELESSN